MKKKLMAGCMAGITLLMGSCAGKAGQAEKPADDSLYLLVSEASEAERGRMGSRFRKGNDDQGKGLDEHDLER